MTAHKEARQEKIAETEEEAPCSRTKHGRLKDRFQAFLSIISIALALKSCNDFFFEEGGRSVTASLPVIICEHNDLEQFNSNSSTIKLSSFGDLEVFKGDLMQLWFRLTPDRKEEGEEYSYFVGKSLAFQVDLPKEVTYRGVSMFSTLASSRSNDGCDGTPHVHLGEDNQLFLWTTNAFVNKNQSCIINVDVIIDSFPSPPSEGILAFPAKASLFPPPSYPPSTIKNSTTDDDENDSSKGVETVREATASPCALHSNPLSVQIAKKKQAAGHSMFGSSQRSSSYERKEKKSARGGASVAPGQKHPPYQHFPRTNCSAFSTTTSLVEECYEVCSHSQGLCRTCGYGDAAHGCVCETGQESLIFSTATDLQQQQQQPLVGYHQLPYLPTIYPTHTLDPYHAFHKVNQILVFPHLLPEAACQDLDRHLARLLHGFNTTRKIITTKDTPGAKKKGKEKGKGEEEVKQQQQQGEGGEEVKGREEENENYFMHRLLRRYLPLSPEDVLHTDTITFANESKPVIPHYDQLKEGDETHKLLIYMDDVAGTRFWEQKGQFTDKVCPLEIGANRGTVVVFPISLWHDSQWFEGPSTRTRRRDRRKERDDSGQEEGEAGEGKTERMKGTLGLRLKCPSLVGSGTSLMSLLQ